MTEHALELKGRSVWQVMASYGIGAWLVLQVAETLSSLIGLPLWFGRALLVVLVAGFVLLLATSVVQGRAARGPEARAWARLLTWGGTARAGLVALGVMVIVTGAYLAARSAGVGPFGTLRSRGVFEAQERLILADFEGNAEQSGLGETVATLLRIDLAQSPTFSVLEPVQLAPVLARMQRDPSEPVTYDVALEAARREGIKAIVTGEIVQAGSSVVISARIVAAGTGDALVAVRETAAALTDLPDVVDRLSARLRERVGESLRTIQGDAPLNRVTTGSLQALEKYAQAQRAMDQDDLERAMILLQEAIGADSTFAMAHRKLGIVLLNLETEGGRGTVAFTRAYELRERLTDRERWLAEAAYLAYVADDPDGSMSRYETLLGVYPTDPTALNNLAVAYLGLGRTDEAAELYLRSVRQGGAPATTFTGLIPILYASGDTAEARRVLREFERSYPENSRAASYGANFLSAVFDYGGAEREVRRVLEQVRGTFAEGNAWLALAQIHVVQGRAEEALESLDRGFAALRADGISPSLTPGVAEALTRGAVELFYREDPDAAVRLMDEVLAEHGVDDGGLRGRADLSFALLYAIAGRPDRAGDAMERYAAGSEPAGSAWTGAEAMLALAEGRVDEAIVELRGVLAAGPDCRLCTLGQLGRAFEVAAQPDSAVHYLEAYLGTRDLERLSTSDNIFFWDVVPRLGALQAQQGNASRARELYGLFLRVTAEADAAFEPKRDRVRAELQALGG